METLDTIIIIFSALVFSAFFSGMEIAFVSSNKLIIELEKKQGVLSSRIISSLLHSPSRFIATMLVGNNIALVVYGIFSAKALEPWIQQVVQQDVLVLLIQTVISTILILIAAEFLPKAIFSFNSNGLLKVFALPTAILYYLLAPIALLTIGLSNFILKYIFGEENSEEKPVFRRVDLDNFLREHTDEKEEQDEVEAEVQFFQNALDFSKVKVRDCLIPRTEVVALEVDEPIQKLRDKFYETGLGKILIYKDSIDQIIGYVHSFELFKMPETIRSILLPVPMVPESMPARELLNMLLQEHKSLAVVVDEFGGTAGIVAVEDVIEEIFGDIEDEHDTESLREEQLEENKFIFSARLEIDYINDNHKLGLPESEDYETLGGLIVAVHESIPEEGEIILYENFHFTIQKSSNQRIEEVIVRVDSDE